MYCFCVFLCIVCVYMCTELLPPGGYPIAVKHISYIISYDVDFFPIINIFSTIFQTPRRMWPVHTHKHKIIQKPQTPFTINKHTASYGYLGGHNPPRVSLLWKNTESIILCAHIAHQTPSVRLWKEFHELCAGYLYSNFHVKKTRGPDQESHRIPSLETSFLVPRLKGRRWYNVLISRRRNSKNLKPPAP